MLSWSINKNTTRISRGYYVLTDSACTYTQQITSCRIPISLHCKTSQHWKFKFVPSGYANLHAQLPTSIFYSNMWNTFSSNIESASLSLPSQMLQGQIFFSSAANRFEPIIMRKFLYNFFYKYEKHSLDYLSKKYYYLASVFVCLPLRRFTLFAQGSTNPTSLRI